MKKFWIIAWLLPAICLPAAAEAEETDLTPLIGTWVNPEYNPTDQTPKFVYKADRTIEAFGTTEARVPSYCYTFTVEEAWRDEAGAAWYRIVAVKTHTLEERFVYLLIRIGPDGTTYEEDRIRGHLREFPDVLDPDSFFYKKLYRE